MTTHNDLIQQATALMQQAEALRRQEIRATAQGFLEKMATDNITIADLRDVARSMPNDVNRRTYRRRDTPPLPDLSPLTPRPSLPRELVASPPKVAPPKPVAQVRKKKWPEHANCAECHKPLSPDEISFCGVFSSRFGGRMLCRAHQKPYPG